MGDKPHFWKPFELPLVHRHVVPRKTRVTVTRRKSEGYQMILPPLIVPNKEGNSDDEEGYISEESEPPSSWSRVPDRTGITVYLAACRKYNVVPLTSLRRQLQSDTVSIKSQNMQGHNAKALAIALVVNESVTTVDLEGSFLGKTGIKYIADVFYDNDTITELNLSGNKLKLYGLKILVDNLRQNRSLRALDLSDNGFTKNDARCLKELLLSKCKIRKLNLSRNKFEDSGGLLIAEGLAENTSLLELNISWNHLRGHEGSAIGHSLMNNNTLEVLDVSWNGFGVSGCHGLGKGLDANTSLRELNLSSNRIDPDAVAKFLEGLKNNNTLTCLKIGDNPLGSGGALAVLKAAKHCTNIEEIDIGNQPVSTEFADALTKLQADREIQVRHGKVLCRTKQDVPDDTIYIPGNPLLILFEFIRIKNLDILDVFKTLDANGNHSITWKEFHFGIKKSHIPVRPKDFEKLIKKMDINKDGEINFSELVLAQKSHNAKAEKLLKSGLDTFYDSDIGPIHQELHKWCCDKNVNLKKYKLVE
ncbi:leucine-rich repeat-containing protein 74B-like [Argopecten irradians]|uniref:leucine-rich repeat-containing protein 74B-like n=1 Tax=Argopecten irradians TaxID=31199 RepID=UPI00371B71D3